MTFSQPFDPLAATYDDSFTHTLVGRYLRECVHARLERHFLIGDHVLELGCGTGEDALWLAGRGISVLATDASEAMLEITRTKAAGNDLVRLEKLDLNALTPRPPLPQREREQVAVGVHQLQSEGFMGSAEFVGVFANFGPLNCLEDWRPLAGWLAKRIKRGGIAAFGVMSPFCIWEIAWHGLHGDFKTAFRRWRKDTRFAPSTRGLSPLSHREELSVRYPTIRRLTRDFAPFFRRVHVEPLGLFLPPSDVFAVVEKRPRILKLLTGFENRFRTCGKLALLADHYWIEFRREG